MARNENIKVITRKDGTKLFPVGSVYKYQHVFDNFNTRHAIGEFDKEDEELYEIYDSHLYEFAVAGTYLGMYYTEGKYVKKIRRIIEKYVDRHGGIL